jgi:protein tyrosine phosphatase
LAHHFIGFGGKGRTGTTIAALLELQKLERYGGDELDVCGTVSEMRTCRSLLVETLEQYKFIFWVCLSLIDSKKLKYAPGAILPKLQ